MAVEAASGRWRAVALQRHGSAERRWGAMLALPAALYFLIFWLAPLATALYYSLTDYSLVGTPEWVGIDNYRRMVHDPQFWHSVRVTALYTVGSVVPTIVLALLIALPLSRPGRINAWLRGLIFIPAVMPLVAATIVWKVIYSTDGMANTVLGAAGASPQPWLTGPHLALWSLIAMVVWKNLGLFLIIFLAGLQAIPQNVYEAAAIDGSSRVRTFVLVTLPLLRRTFLFVVVIAVVGAMQSFVPAYLLTGGGPATATEVLPLYLYNTAFSFLRMGYASSLAVVLLVALLLLSLAQFRMFRGGEA